MQKIALILLLILVAGCTKTTCAPQYLEYKTGDCCLDNNKDNICDRDQTPQQIVANRENAIREDTNAKITAQLTDANNTSVYKAIKNTMNGHCEYYGVKTAYAVENGSMIETKSWMPIIGCLCSTIQDCRDCFEQTFLPSLNAPESELTIVREQFSDMRCN